MKTDSALSSLCSYELFDVTQHFGQLWTLFICIFPYNCYLIQCKCLPTWVLEKWFFLKEVAFARCPLLFCSQSSRVLLSCAQRTLDLQDSVYSHPCLMWFLRHPPQWFDLSLHEGAVGRPRFVMINHLYPSTCTHPLSNKLLGFQGMVIVHIMCSADTL